MQTLFFYSSFLDLLRALAVGVMAYLGLIAILRISGKRSLAKLNTFDFIVTIALGSMLGSAVLDRTVSLAETLIAFVVLLGMQYLVSWLSVRTAFVPRLVKNRPALLGYRGELHTDDLKRARVTEGEVYQALRAQGYSRLGDVHAIVLETDGTISCVRPPQTDAGTSTLTGLSVPRSEEGRKAEEEGSER